MTIEMNEHGVLIIPDVADVKLSPDPDSFRYRFNIVTEDDQHLCLMLTSGQVQTLLGLGLNNETE